LAVASKPKIKRPSASGFPRAQTTDSPDLRQGYRSEEVAQINWEMEMQFRKKPVVIDAVQHTADPQSNQVIIDWTSGSGTPAYLDRDGYEKPQLFVKTLEGDHLVSVGDWVIRGVEGEHYACKPSIFAATYDPA
jgi:hypothetical protein